MSVLVRVHACMHRCVRWQTIHDRLSMADHDQISPYSPALFRLSPWQALSLLEVVPWSYRTIATGNRSRLLCACGIMIWASSGGAVLASTARMRRCHISVSPPLSPLFSMRSVIQLYDCRCLDLVASDRSYAVTITNANDCRHRTAENLRRTKSAA